VTDFFTMMEKLQGMFDSDDVEVITNDGRRVRGRIDNLRSTQPFSRPAVKITWKEIAPGAHQASDENAPGPALEIFSSCRGDA
jgi:hypothetical protein